MYTDPDSLYLTPGSGYARADVVRIGSRCSARLEMRAGRGSELTASALSFQPHELPPDSSQVLASVYSGDDPHASTTRHRTGHSCALGEQRVHISYRHTDSGYPALQSRNGPGRDNTDDHVTAGDHVIDLGDSANRDNAGHSEKRPSTGGRVDDADAPVICADRNRADHVHPER